VAGGESSRRYVKRNRFEHLAGDLERRGCKCIAANGDGSE